MTENGAGTGKPGSTISGEIERIRSMYEARDAGMPVDDSGKNIYHPQHPLGRLLHDHNHDILVKALDIIDMQLPVMRVLDVGCGYGYWLRDFIELGADPARLTGIDLSRERIEYARKKSPAVQWIHGSSGDLPFPPESFDLVLQVVVFSSILDETVQKQLAAEMCRVTKRNGYILWIDHKKSFSQELSGFPKARVLELFEGFDLVHARPVHPRYFRRMYKISAALAKAVYRLTRADCDSWALMLKKKNAG